MVKKATFVRLGGEIAQSSPPGSTPAPKVAAPATLPKGKMGTKMSE